MLLRRLGPAAVGLVLINCGCWAQQHVISTVAGGGLPPSGVPALSTGIEVPIAAAADAFGNLFISTRDNWVFKVDQAGVLTRVAGTGTAGYSGDDGLAVNTQLNRPAGLAVDKAGNLYIGDYFNNRIRKVSPDGILSSVPVNAPAEGPNAVAVDSAANVYVLGAALVAKVSIKGVATAIAGNGSIGYSGDGGPATSAQMYAISTLSLAFDSADNLYIADFYNHRIRMVTPAGVITTVAGNGTQGYSGDGGPATSAQIDSPRGIFVDSKNNLFIADGSFQGFSLLNNGYRVRKVSAGSISTVPNIPVGLLAIDKDDNLYAANFSINTVSPAIIYKISPTGIVTDVAGNGTLGSASSGDGGPATGARLGSPYGVAVDADHNFYFADRANHRVRKVSPGGIITTLVGTGVAGFSGDGGLAVNSRLNSPQAVAVDSARNVYIADTGNNRIRKVSPSGLVTSLDPQVISPQALAVDRDDNLYFVDSQRVRKMLPGGIVTTVAGNGTQGFSGDGGPAISAQLFNPRAIAVDRERNLFIAETNLIRKVSPNGIITTFAGTGVADYSDSGGKAALDGNLSPTGLAVDASGNLYIMDVHFMYKVSPIGIITSLAGTLAGGSDLGDGGLALGAHFSSPQGIAVDTNGDIYFADSGNNRVRRLQRAPFSNVNSASFVAGTVAPNMIAFGEANGIAPALQVAPSGAWPTTLGGVTLEITDSQGQKRLAPIYYAAPGAISYLIPAATAWGRATVKLTSSSGSIINGAMEITGVSPGIYTANSSGSGVAAAYSLRFPGDGTYTQALLYNPATNNPVPVDLGAPTDQVYLSLYGTGFRLSPTVAVSASVGGVNVRVAGFTAVNQYQGLDIVNIGPLPRSLAGRGEVPIVLVFDNKLANVVSVNIR